MKQKSKLFSKKLWTVLTPIFAVLLAVFIIGTICANTLAYAAINMLFGITPSKTIGMTESMRFESDWLDVNGEGLFIADKITIRQAGVEGMVLLWNDEIDGGEKALPVPKDSKVSALSHSSVDIVETGTGSGAIETVNQSGQDRKTTLLTALSRYYAVNQDLWNFYDVGAGSGYVRDKGWGSSTKTWTVNEVPWSVYESEGITGSFAEYGDAALVFISRTGGENGDLHFSKEVATEDGGYLGLSPEEKDLLQHVTDLRRGGTFKRVVLVINTANPLSMQDFEPYREYIDAAMFMGQGGTAGVNALAELLVGNESPSGRLADTWAYDLFSHPSTENDDGGASSQAGTSGQYSNYADYKGKIPGYSGSNDNLWSHYMVYQEGIYVGYKYYETRYTDGIANPSSNANTAAGAKHSEGNWNYAQEVAFPFGYGDSYTTFSYSGFNVTENEDDYTVSVTVLNTGDYAAKEVVQVYLSKPYTEHDKQAGIEVAAVELVGFAKTDKIEPGLEDTVEITVPKDYFKTYDPTYDNGDTEGRYVVEAGDYYLTAATDSHVAANNILLSQDKEPQAHTVLSGDARAVSMGDSFVKKLTLEEDAETYKVSRQTGVEIHNQLQEADINTYSGRGDNQVTYMSRSDWESTYPAGGAQLKMTDQMAKDLAVSKVDASVSESKEMPAFSKFASGSTDGLPHVDKGDLVAIDFIDAPLNEYSEGWSEEWEDKWNQLLDQMSWEEMANLCANAFHQLMPAESIALPATKQENGPAGITKRTESNWQIPNKNVTDYVYVAYPSAVLLACTFNVEIVEEIGKAISENMLYTGYNGIYGPGGNIHRSPFGGRNWEYYSEDPVLSGLIGSAQVKGIESKGCMAYVKHFAFNDMETYRHHNNIWSNEQASREVYLKAFEIIFTDGKASATMNSFTRVGTTWAGMCEELQTNILREEWGWDGLNITDWIESDFMAKPDAIFAGTNSFDGNGTPSSYFGGWENNADFAWKLRESAKTIIYNVVSTHAFNGMTRESIVIEITPWWQVALYSCIGVFAVLTAASGAMLAVSVMRDRKAKALSGGEAK